MKKVIIESLKKYKIQLVIQIIFIIINIYLLTVPAKIIGNMIDLLYNLDENKQVILNNTYYLLGICIVLLIIRMIWKRLLKIFCVSYWKRYKSKIISKVFKT